MSEVTSSAASNRATATDPSTPPALRNNAKVLVASSSSSPSLASASAPLRPGGVPSVRPTPHVQSSAAGRGGALSLGGRPATLAACCFAGLGVGGGDGRGLAYESVLGICELLLAGRAAPVGAKRRPPSAPVPGARAGLRLTLFDARTAAGAWVGAGTWAAVEDVCLACCGATRAPSRTRAALDFFFLRFERPPSAEISAAADIVSLSNSAAAVAAAISAEAARREEV
mmetsp:Transcript_40252/g.90338  ORF Transcript_40252/g.90338 Transcript_40252/m.90338 type:complete len:228 (+) Transcript_40252:743-1426(+)